MTLGNRQWHQAVSLTIEAIEPVGERKAAQPPVEVVGPAVESARQPAARAAWGVGGASTAVAAHVEECLHRAGLVAGDDDGHAAVVVGEEASRPGQLRRVADDDRMVPEQRLPLLAEAHRVDVLSDGALHHGRTQIAGVRLDVSQKAVDQRQLEVTVHGRSQFAREAVG